MMRIRILTTSVIFLLNFSRFFGLAAKPASDQLVIEQLKKAGSDISKPHEIDFFLYFPTQAAAQEVAQIIQESGFEAKVSRAALGPNWLCKARKKMIPKLDALLKIRHDFTTMAIARHGEYDGWGAAVVK